MADHGGGNHWTMHGVCLTSRQIEIIGFAAQGMPAEEVAQRLGISPRTVEGHVSTARTRTGARNLTELVARCYACGILPAGLWPPLTGPGWQPLRPGSPGGAGDTAVPILQAAGFPAGHAGREPDRSQASSYEAVISHRLIGLACLSGDSRDARRQHDALTGAGCSRIFEEEIPARGTGRRPGLAAALSHLRPGDTLCVCRLDHLGRRIREVQVIAADLHERGAALRILTNVPVGSYAPAR